MFHSKILDHDNGIIKENFVVNCESTDRLSIKLLLINKEKCNIDLYKYNYIDIIYTDNINTSLININENNISYSLSKIEENKSNILSNLSKIKELNQNKTYFKNLENILFYDKKTQVDFRNLFFEKIFKIDADINNFIEIDFKISLEYENISERNYVKIIYQILDENDNSLFIKSVNNNEYSCFSNKIFINENIFYNFNKPIDSIKFIIKFQILLSRIIQIWYIKNDYYIFILKHYST